MNPEERTTVGRMSRYAAVVTALGAVGMLLAVVYATLRLEAVQRETRTIAEHRDALKKEIEKLKSQRDAAELETREAIARAALAKEAIKGNNRVIEQTPRAADLLPRIYVLLGANAETAAGEKLADLLRAAGFIVPRITPVNKGFPETTIHFYRETDRGDAIRAQEVVMTAGFGNVRVSLDKVPPNVALRPRHFDLRLSSPSS